MRAYDRRMTEFVAYCPKHIGIGFPGYHVGYEQNPATGERERLFACSFCNHEFRQSQGMECDSRG